MEEEERKILEQVLATATAMFLATGCHVSFEALERLAPPDIKFSTNIYDKRCDDSLLLDRSITSNHPNAVKYFMERGARVEDMPSMLSWINKHSSLASCQVFVDLSVEKMFIGIIVRGLASPTVTLLTQFLVKGVYDPRLLIHVATFAFTEDVSHKRKF